jgi:hypothetical protein
MGDADTAGSNGSRWVGGAAVLAAIALVAALVALRSEDGDPDREPLQVQPATPAADSTTRTESTRRAGGRVFVPEEDGTLEISAAAVAEGGPLTVELRLPPEEISELPMTGTLRSAGRTYPLGAAEVDSKTGILSLTIDPARLTPGTHLLAIRVADDSWNPHRRVMITVGGD